MTCENIRILIKNQMLSATITGDKTQAGKPLKNIVNTWRSRFARFDENESQSILFDRINPEIADTFYLKMDGKLVTARLLLYAGNRQTGKIVHDSGVKYVSYLIPLGLWRVGIDAYGATVNNADNILVQYFDKPVIYRSGRIICNEKSPKEGADLDVYFAALGQSFVPQTGANFGAVLTPNFSQSDRRTRGGSLLSVGNKAKWRELSVSFAKLSTQERVRYWNDLQETGGKGAFINLYPDNDNVAFEQQNAFIANIVPSGFSHNDVDIHALEQTFREV